MWPTSNPIARELDEFWKESQSLWQQYQVEADLDCKFATGQQNFNYGYSGLFNTNQNRQLQFNKIMRIINMIGGYQRDNRLASIVTAADNDPDMGETADQLSKVLGWVMRQDQTYDRVSECFDGAITSGLNLLSVWLDTREDPENGEIKTTRLPFSSFIMSPYWTKHDLSDCDRIWTRRYLTKRELTSIFPKLKGELSFLGKGFAAKDGKFQFMPQNWYQHQLEIYAYDEYWVRDYKKKRKILDKATGELADWNGTREQFQLFRRFNPNIELITAQVPSVRLHVLVNGNHMYEEKEPYGLTRFPFVPFVAYHNVEVQNYAFRYYGVVRNIRDSQIELNRRRNRLLDILDAQVQSGLMVKEDALVNPEDAFLQGPGKMLFFKQSANLASDVAPIPPPPVAQGWMELIQSLDQEIMSIVGTPEELYGENTNSKDYSGFMMKLKMGAGLKSLQSLFDNLNASQMALGNIQLEMLQNNFGVGKIAKIIGEKPTEVFNQSWMNKFNCVVEEAQLTSTQRQLEFIQAVQLKQIMPDTITNEYLLEKSTLQGKKALIEQEMQRAQQAQQMEQAQMQAQMQQQQVMTRSLEAKAQSDFSSAIEKKATAVQKIALAKQEASQAVHQRAAAALDNSKALKELAEMDENRLIKLAQFVLDLQERQKALQGSEEGDSEVQANAMGSDVQQAEMQTRPQSMQPQQESSLASSLQ